MTAQHSPEKQRENIRQKELKNNPLGSLAEGVNKGRTGNHNDLTGSLDWRVTGSLLVVILVGIASYLLFFN